MQSSAAQGRSPLMQRDAQLGNMLHEEELETELLVTPRAASPAPTPRRNAVGDGSTDARHDTCIIVLCCVSALFAGFPNAFNTIADSVQADLRTSDAYIATMTGVGVAGLQFTIIGGVLLDRFGPDVTIAVGGMCTTLGFLAMSFARNLVLAYALYVAVGFGSGTVFIAVLMTAIKLGRPVGIGMVSLSMSLSLSTCVLITNTYAEAYCTSKHHPACWRSYVRVYAAFMGFVFLVSAAGLRMVRRKLVALEHPLVCDSRLPPDPARTLSPAKLLLQCGSSLRAFGTWFFWCLFIGDLVGVGCGVFVITNASQLYHDFDPRPNRYSDWVSVLFSVCTGVGNVFSPVISDWLHKRAILTRASFLAIILCVFSADFLAMALMLARQHGHEHAPSDTMCYVFIALLAVVGYGFGTFLVLLPTSVSDAYGIDQFGKYLSHMQLGVAIFAIFIPGISSLVHHHEGHYTPLFFAFSGALLLAGVAMLSATAKQPLQQWQTSHKIGLQAAPGSHQYF